MYRFSFAGDDFSSILLLHFYIIFGLNVGDQNSSKLLFHQLLSDLNLPSLMGMTILASPMIIFLMMAASLFTLLKGGMLIVRLCVIVSKNGQFALPSM